jgi:hypothetical protein
MPAMFVDFVNGGCFQMALFMTIAFTMASVFNCPVTVPPEVLIDVSDVSVINTWGGVTCQGLEMGCSLIGS